MPHLPPARDPLNVIAEIDILRQAIQRLWEALKLVDDPQEMAKCTNALSAACHRLGALMREYHQAASRTSSVDELLFSVLRSLDDPKGDTIDRDG